MDMSQAQNVITALIINKVVDQYLYSDNPTKTSEPVFRFVN